MAKRLSKFASRTEAGGTVLQCPHCGHLVVVYGFGFSALGCTRCQSPVEKTDWVLPELSPIKKEIVRGLALLDNEIREACAKKFKRFWIGREANHARYWREFENEYNALVAGTDMESGSSARMFPDRDPE